MTTCEHLDIPTATPDPESDGCADCLTEGTRWVHLRQCLDCGRIGCCDSSPRQHASRHYRSEGHPVMRSVEPGESWRWCYADEMLAV